MKLVNKPYKQIVKHPFQTNHSRKIKRHQSKLPSDKKKKKSKYTSANDSAISS